MAVRLKRLQFVNNRNNYGTETRRWFYISRRKVSYVRWQWFLKHTRQVWGRETIMMMQWSCSWRVSHRHKTWNTEEELVGTVSLSWHMLCVSFSHLLRLQELLTSSLCISLSVKTHCTSYSVTTAEENLGSRPEPKRHDQKHWVCDTDTIKEQLVTYTQMIPSNPGETGRDLSFRSSVLVITSMTVSSWSAHRPFTRETMQQLEKKTFICLYCTVQKQTWSWLC